jgi:hypothetical protein
MWEILEARFAGLQSYEVQTEPNTASYSWIEAVDSERGRQNVELQLWWPVPRGDHWYCTVQMRGVSGLLAIPGDNEMQAGRNAFGVLRCRTKYHLNG